MNGEVIIVQNHNLSELSTYSISEEIHPLKSPREREDKRKPPTNLCNESVVQV